jgi:hypothetical protein
MKPLLFGAVLALLWLLFGLPVAVSSTVLAPLLQPVVLGFAAGLLTRPHLARSRRWTA